MLTFDMTFDTGSTEFNKFGSRESSHAGLSNVIFILKFSPIVSEIAKGNAPKMAGNTRRQPNGKITLRQACLSRCKSSLAADHPVWKYTSVCRDGKDSSRGLGPPSPPLLQAAAAGVDTHLRRRAPRSASSAAQSTSRDEPDRARVPAHA